MKDPFWHLFSMIHGAAILDGREVQKYEESNTRTKFYQQLWGERWQFNQAHASISAVVQLICDALAEVGVRRRCSLKTDCNTFDGYCTIKIRR